MNEFGSLTPDELHFLRVFIYCEGRIRDMEAALGVSYPTVKGHLASIKEKLNLARMRPQRPGVEGAQKPGGEAPQRPGGESPAAAAAPAPSAEDVLEGLESGRLSYKDALKMLRARKKEETGDEQRGG